MPSSAEYTSRKEHVCYNVINIGQDLILHKHSRYYKGCYIKVRFEAVIKSVITMNFTTH